MSPGASVGASICSTPAFARFRRLTRWALIALTAATIVAYFALIQGQYDALGIGNKITEVLLIVLLVVFRTFVATMIPIALALVAIAVVVLTVTDDAGKTGTAVLQLVTLGGLGIWALVDFIMIIVGSFTDGEGEKITEWV